MTKGLGWKVVLIVAVVLIFAYGIFGVPAGFSGGALADALLSSSTFRNGIHLGLDLKGGTHLILQVQVNDAINADSDTAITRERFQFYVKELDGEGRYNTTWHSNVVTAASVRVGPSSAANPQVNFRRTCFGPFTRPAVEAATVSRLELVP